MNELERLIANVDRPEPTGRLDACVKALIQSQSSPPTRRWQNAFVVCGAAACMGILGFFVGRQSVTTATDSSAAMASTAPRHSAEENTLRVANVTSVSLADDKLAGWFVRRDQGEGLLGGGPVTILTSNSP
jgi:hypothetical protein